MLDFFRGAQQKAAQLQEIKRSVLTDDVLRKMHGDFARWRQDRRNDAVCDRKLSDTATLQQILRDGQVLLTPKRRLGEEVEGRGKDRRLFHVPDERLV